MQEQYAHLDEDARDILGAADDERIRHIQKDRFIPYRAVTTVLDAMADFVRRPVSIRPPCLALVGDSGCGKSTLCLKFLRSFDDADEPATRLSIYCVIDPYPQLRVMQQALLTALGVPLALTMPRSPASADDVIGRALKELGTRVVIFDEANHLHNLPRRAQASLWDWIKWVSTANRVSVVCLGIPGFEQTVREESQLETRFSIVRLPRWTVGPTFQQFLMAFEQSLPLKRPSGLATLAMQTALLQESGVKQQVAGITQGIKQVIEHAAIEAIRRGTERVTLELLSSWRDGFEPQMLAVPESRRRRRARRG